MNTLPLELRQDIYKLWITGLRARCKREWSRSLKRILKETKYDFGKFHCTNFYGERLFYYNNQYHQKFCITYGRCICDGHKYPVVDNYQQHHVCSWM